MDWVQFESPHSVEEIKRVRAAVPGILSAMQGRLPRALTLPEHAELGLTIAWYTFLPDRVLKAACWEFMESFARDGLQAWLDYQTAHPGNPFARDRGVPDLVGADQLRALEEKYFSAERLGKYQAARDDQTRT